MLKKKKEINKKEKDKSSNKSAYERNNNIENEYCWRLIVL